jgi:uncharacterized membrane protein YciS (DUF1049 family)
MRKISKPDVSSFSPKGRNFRRYITVLAWFVILTALFALGYNQSPLYTSNQNQYFLHGYAQAGYGTLSEDWLAKTADPTPVFSFLVAATIRLFHNENLFFVYYALLFGIYLFSLFGIVEQVFSLRSSKLTAHIFIVAIILLHSTVLRFLIMRLFGGDWPYLFEGGVAGQRLLGPVFQPSSFGVFLLLSIYLYLRDKKYLAVLSAVLAATIHPTYLLSAAALTLAFLIDTFRGQKKVWPAIRLGLLALVAVAPILIYTYIKFGGGGSEVEAAARDILVNIRIPPHAIVSAWFNATVIVKLAFLGIGLFLARRQRVFVLLLVPLSLAIGLTIVQVISNNYALALIFPWRLSTWLVPVAVGLILGWLVTVVVPRVPVSLEGALKTTGLVLIGLAVAAGMVRTYLESNEWAGLSYRPIEAYVAMHRQPGQLYLTPSKVYDFRLEAGVPIYVDFLSIPYQAADVIEWDRRFRLSTFFYQRTACGKLNDLYGEGVTHVVLPIDFPANCPQLVEIYGDSAYRLYELTP